jgi:cell division protein FtsZ
MTPLTNLPTNNDYHHSSPRIRAMGLGGAGCNAIHRLSSIGIEGVELIAANTDRQCLASIQADHKILLGSALTGGMGSGGDPRTGQAAAEESFRELIAEIRDCDLLFLTAGMGGGTGSGAIQIAARIAKSLGVLTISIVTIPFSFEAGKRQTSARESIATLQPFTDTLITIPNDRLLKVAPPETTLQTAFALADDILMKSIQGISGMLCSPGLLDVDISHVLRMMKTGGGTYISIGAAEGRDRALTAIDNALSHPLLEEIQIREAKGIIVKFSGNLTIAEIDQAMEYLQTRTSPETEIIPAVNAQDRLDGHVQVTLLATGIGAIAIEYPAEPTHERDIEKVSAVIQVEQDTSGFSFEAAEKDLDDLEVPAFIRRGYNHNEKSVCQYG